MLNVHGMLNTWYGSVLECSVLCAIWVFVCERISSLFSLNLLSNSHTLSSTWYHIWRLGTELTKWLLHWTTAFHPDLESVKLYLKRVSLYFLANSVKDDKKVPVLLSCIGFSTYALLSDLLAPETPGSMSAEISATLTSHFQPQRSIIPASLMLH